MEGDEEMVVQDEVAEERHPDLLRMSGLHQDTACSGQL